MAKTRPQHKSPKSKRKNKNSEKPQPNPAELYAQVISLLQTGQPEEALIIAQKLLKVVSPASTYTLASLPALSLLGEICIEIGDAEESLSYFSEAAKLDPDGIIPEDEGGGAEKFLWLAQLCQEGGKESVGWFEKGASVLRRDIGNFGGAANDEPSQLLLDEKKKRLANVLCGVTEVYMTDLSWEENAEARCEALVTEALLVSPNNPEVLQTVASVRISQTRLEDARSALQRSMELWKDLPPEDADVPDFPTRISLCRLLIEADLRDDALDVLERLVLEDDQSVEAWYLGGWCQYLNAEAQKEASDLSNGPVNGDQVALEEVMKSSRKWLLSSLKLYQQLDYEDERLGAHARELVASLNDTLGPPPEGDEADDDDEWEDEEADEDHEMGTT
ncbi:MAG: hypothetical protein M1821_007635 [Bathelium mastoideum]|nr:MAG: hypothetical protein M1821_007635 [Bathelium mastoideum]